MDSIRILVGKIDSKTKAVLVLCVTLVAAMGTYVVAGDQQLQGQLDIVREQMFGDIEKLEEAVYSNQGYIDCIKSGQCISKSEYEREIELLKGFYGGLNP